MSGVFLTLNTKALFERYPIALYKIMANYAKLKTDVFLTLNTKALFEIYPFAL